MRFIFGFLVGLALLVGACQPEGKNSTTPGGFAYEIHTSTGGEKPQPEEFVKFNLQVMAGDSLLYDSSLEEQTPTTPMPPEGETSRSPIPLEDVLMNMAVNDSATLYYPMDSLPQKPPGFDGVEFLEYKIVITAILSAEEHNAERQAELAKQQAEMQVIQAREPEVAALVQDMVKGYADGSLEGELQSTESGLKYLIHEEGTGSLPADGANIKAHYYGVLTDGTMFDNSFSKGRSFSFRLGQRMVIAGWDEGFALLKQGTKATLFIPYELGYGAAGSPPRIPENADLIFYVESL